MDHQDRDPAEPVAQIGQNIESILAFYQQEEQKLSGSQRLLEYVSNFVGRPYFLSVILLFASLWILLSLVGRAAGWHHFDPPPFFWLQGIVSLCALLITTVVLIKQNRLARFEEQRQHLELQVNLLTEQKTTKLINLIEELRRDLPMVKDRRDPEAEAMQQPTDPHQVLTALDQRRDVHAGRERK